MRRIKKQKTNRTRKDKDISTDFLLGILEALSLPAHYKTDHLLDKLADLPAADLSATVESVSLNAVNVKTTLMPSVGVLPWHPDDDNPGPVYQHKECRVKRIKVNISAFTFDLYSKPVFDDEVFEDPVFASDDNDVPDYDSPTKVNLLDVGTMTNKLLVPRSRYYHSQCSRDHQRGSHRYPWPI